MPEPSKRKSKRERTNFGSKLAGPKIGKLNFGGWRNRSCAIKTNPRQPAPLIRYKPIDVRVGAKSEACAGQWDQLWQLPEILDRGNRRSSSRAPNGTLPEPVKAQDAFEVREQHLDLRGTSWALRRDVARRPQRFRGLSAGAFGGQVRTTAQLQFSIAIVFAGPLRVRIIVCSLAAGGEAANRNPQVPKRR